MIFKYLFIGILFYFIYRLIFNVVLPLYKSASLMRQKIQEMQSAQQRENQNNTTPPQAAPQEHTETRQEGEYIDYEEIKD